MIIYSVVKGHWLLEEIAIPITTKITFNHQIMFTVGGACRPYQLSDISTTTWLIFQPSIILVLSKCHLIYGQYICWQSVECLLSIGWVLVVYWPRGVLGISSDRDDWRIFLCLKFSILGFFWVQKFGKYFLGSLIWVGIFGGVKKNR